MPITRKPKGKTSASEAQISALIEKGGRTARQETAARAFSLRIPGPPAERLDDFLPGPAGPGATLRLGFFKPS